MATDEVSELAAALPGYDIGGELGRGAFGVVLSGRHRQLGRQVAIKQLPRSFSDYPEVRRRFSAEAMILASLDHPHIVPIFDYVEQGGLCVLVMEMLAGGTVRERNAAGLSSQAACAIALATCSALDYAHQRGVLHRDIKPDNLLFTGAGLLKVTDFGIAKVVGDVALTQVGETPGTPLYMAPEQCLSEALSPATDVYSTGLMLYELLAGQHPFTGRDAVSTMYRQVHEDAPLLGVAGRPVPAPLAPVVMRTLAKDPSARYSSARAFGGALADAAAEAWGGAWPAGDALRIMSPGPIEATTGRPIAAVSDGDGAVERGKRDPLATNLSPEFARSPTVVHAPAGWASEVVSPGPPWPVPASQPVPTEAFVPPPDAPVPRRRGPLVAAGVLLVVVVVVGGLLALTRKNGGKSATTGTTAPATTRPATSAAQVAAGLNGLIQQSARARSQLVATVASIESCSDDPAAAAAALVAAVSTRQQVVSQLGILAVDVLPNGNAMRLALTNAIDDSIDADRHFQGWLAGITSAGGCAGHAPHDANWQAAQSSSSAATGAKQTFAALWNPVATTYRLPTVTSATI